MRSAVHVTDGGVAVDLDEWRADCDIETGFVGEAEIGGCGVIRALTVEKFVAKTRESQDADQVWVECVRFLSDEILRALILAHGKSRHAGAGRGNRIELIALVEHVTEIQGVRLSQVVIEADAELVVVLGDDLRGGEEIGAGVGEREEAEETGGEGVDVGELVVGIRLVEEDVEELVIGIVAEASGESFGTRGGKIT